ncbi:MAG: response regulator [Anaerolineae bacterium]|nr:response regulator [Anaerolineae bacterium]
MPFKVLAIDDDIAMTELLTLLLQSQNFEIKTANNGPDGIELLREIKPDIILLDLMMPGMDGWETCKKIRSFGNIPIIVISALNNPEIVASALDAGADDFLVKPIPNKVLVAHIKNLARRATGQFGPISQLVNTSKPTFS